MSSASNQLPRSSPDEHATSREDFELFQRFLRVARLLKTHEIDNLGSQDPALTQYTGNNGAGSGLSGPNLIGNSIGYAAGMDDDFNNDEYDDDEEDEEGEEAEEDNTNGAAIYSHAVGLSNRAPQTSQRKQPNNPQNNTGPAAQRQRQQQQQQRAHAAVEKRYRSVVNSKIQQLNALIPPSNTFSPTDQNTPPEDQEAGATQKVPTKSVVIDRAIQYINHLVSTYEQYEAERDELRRKLQLWLDETSSPQVPERINI